MGSARAFVWKHAGLASVLVAGVVLRLAVMIAYPQAFFYTDTWRYLRASRGWEPDTIRQSGYSLLLKVFRRTDSVYLLSGAQHLIGLAIAVALYALLLRRSVPRWLAVPAVVPLLLDGRQLTLEHYVLSETMFTTLVVAGLLALLWPAKLTAGWAAAAGLLLAAGVATRAVSLPLVLLTAGLLALRRVGWRPVLAYSAAAAVVLGGYLAWYHQAHGRYTFSDMQARLLYARVAPFADCDQLEPSLRAICPPQPRSERPPRNDVYVWSGNSPVWTTPDDTLTRFAITVIVNQPGNFLWAVGADVARYLLPMPPHPDWRCLHEATLLPREPPPQDMYDWCAANPRQRFAETAASRQHWAQPSPLTRALGSYSHVGLTPTLVTGGAVILVLVGLCYRPRRRVGSEPGDLVLLGGWGLGLIVLSSITVMYDERYGVPSLALLPAAAALAAERLWRPRRRDAAGDVPGPTSGEHADPSDRHGDSTPPPAPPPGLVLEGQR